MGCSKWDGWGAQCMGQHGHSGWHTAWSSRAGESWRHGWRQCFRQRWPCVLGILRADLIRKPTAVIMLVVSVPVLSEQMTAAEWGASKANHWPSASERH